VTATIHIEVNTTTWGQLQLTSHNNHYWSCSKCDHDHIISHVFSQSSSTFSLGRTLIVDIFGKHQYTGLATCDKHLDFIPLDRPLVTRFNKI